jgi:hypothetical protein
MPRRSTPERVCFGRLSLPDSAGGSRGSGRLYPAGGSTAKAEDAAATQQRIQDVCAVLQHLNKLINLADVKEADEVYINMLALSMSRGKHCPCVPLPPRTDRPTSYLPLRSRDGAVHPGSSTDACVPSPAPRACLCLMRQPQCYSSTCSRTTTRSCHRRSRRSSASPSARFPCACPRARADRVHGDDVASGSASAIAASQTWSIVPVSDRAGARAAALCGRAGCP